MVEFKVKRVPKFVYITTLDEKISALGEDGVDVKYPKNG